MTEFNQACPCCCAGGISVERELELQALLRREWSVRVLDAWTVAKVKAGRWFECFPKDKGQCSCDLIGAAGRESYWADDPDAARHAAALAVFPTLPAAKQAELGECP